MSSTSQWKSVRLGDVLRLINGRAYKKAEHLDNGTPVIRIQNLNGGNRWFYSNLSLPDDKYCESGDLLFAWSASFGPYIWSGEKSIYHYHIWKVEVGDDLDKAFAFRLLEHLTQKIKDSGRGISMVHVTKSGMEAWEISIPPLAEQKRIAAILDQADALRKHRQRALDHLNQLGQSIFYEMFGEQSDSLNRALFEVGTVHTGKTPPTSRSELFDGAVPFVTPGDLESKGEIKRSLTEEGVKFSKLVKTGSTFVCCIGATIGKIGQAKGPSSFNQQINAIEWKEDVNSTYGTYALIDKKPEIIHKGKGASTTLPILKKSSFEKIKITIPSFDEQERFSKAIEKVDSEIKKQNNAKEREETLFVSLQQRAFSGKL